ncbi:MAG: sulfatase-like hydrolase/transferase, partial [Saprospiraceae bacterium]
MEKLFLLLILLFPYCLKAQLVPLTGEQKPNFIFILTDDLGYGDVGVFFQNQRQQLNDKSKPYELTPNIDALANSGARFTQQYCNAPVCAPSRASLLTGVNQGNARVR